MRPLGTGQRLLVTTHVLIGEAQVVEGVSVVVIDLECSDEVINRFRQIPEGAERKAQVVPGQDIS